MPLSQPQPTHDTPEYLAYKAKVVEACVELMGEELREWFESCSFEDEMREEEDPSDVAYAQWESLNGSR